MALILKMEGVADGISEPFTSDVQPYYVLMSGNFSPRQSWHSKGSVIVECQMENGEWAQMVEMQYSRTYQDPFRMPPGVMGRVVVKGCTSVNIEVHDDADAGGA